MQQREGVQLVGGAGRQLAQHVRPVAGALHRDVARAALQPLRQRDHLRPHDIMHTLHYVYLTLELSWEFVNISYRIN